MNDLRILTGDPLALFLHCYAFIIIQMETNYLVDINIIMQLQAKPKYYADFNKHMD